ncbi:hypothetical protein D4764_21G0004540, partial [Takifugu flavidus]
SVTALLSIQPGTPAETKTGMTEDSGGNALQLTAAGNYRLVLPCLERALHRHTAIKATMCPTTTRAGNTLPGGLAGIGPGQKWTVPVSEGRWGRVKASTEFLRRGSCLSSQKGQLVPPSNGLVASPQPLTLNKAASCDTCLQSLHINPLQVFLSASAFFSMRSPKGQPRSPRGRGGWREGGREGGKDGGGEVVEGGREGVEGGREGGMEGVREWREGGREGVREWREGGREGGRDGGRDGGREGGREEGGREGWGQGLG